jgi:polysaccharide deacetylase family protein (PEP-CTERM system associated)
LIGSVVPHELVNAFTVDVEDYFQVSGFERDIPRSAWDSFESRVIGNTRRLLDLLLSRDVRGTFFVLGWVAQRYPFLIREILAAGHEVGSHSHWHRLVYQLSPSEFRQDLRDSIAAIEDAGGVAVTSYRAPSFSITLSSLWALEILVEEGITTDSSIFPTRHDRYGIPGAKLEMHPIETLSGTIWEYPPTVIQVAGQKVPAAGGGYFRLYPWWLTNRLLQQASRQGRPLMFYVHPWEIDPAQPRLHAGTRLNRFRHYVNLSSTEIKLERLLATYRFGTMSEAIAAHCGNQTSVQASAPAMAS